MKMNTPKIKHYHKISRTKNPTLSQLKNIRENLSNKFSCPVYLHIEITNNKLMTYKIYFGPHEIKYYRTWKDLQNKYFEFMKKEKGE